MRHLKSRAIIVAVPALVVTGITPLVTAATPSEDPEHPIESYFKAHDFNQHEESESNTRHGRSLIASGIQYHVNSEQALLEDLAAVRALIDDPHYDKDMLVDVTIAWSDAKSISVRTVGGKTAPHGCTVEQLTELTQIALQNAPLSVECHTTSEAPTIVVGSSLRMTDSQDTRALEQSRINAIQIPSWGTVKLRVVDDAFATS